MSEPMLTLHERLAEWEDECLHVSRPLADGDRHSEFVLATCMRCGGFAVLKRAGATLLAVAAVIG